LPQSSISAASFAMKFNNMGLSGKLLTIALVFVMIVNSVGISQVTHICKLAVDGIEKTNCPSGCGSHLCCTEDKDGQKENLQNVDCCTSIIKYYHQNITTTLKQFYKIQPINVFISLFTSLIPDVAVALNTSFFREQVFFHEKSGRSIIIDIRSILI
jgi:accessory colonization factor AcfC